MLYNVGSQMQERFYAPPVTLEEHQRSFEERFESHQLGQLQRQEPNGSVKTMRCYCFIADPQQPQDVGDLAEFGLRAGLAGYREAHSPIVLHEGESFDRDHQESTVLLFVEVP